MCAEAQTFTIMLPSEITSIITNELKTYKDMASFLSVSKHYLELRNHVLWDKEAIKPNKIFDLPYYDQFVSIILSNKYCRYIPKNIKKISVTKNIPDRVFWILLSDEKFKRVTTLSIFSKLSRNTLSGIFMWLTCLDHIAFHHSFGKWRGYYIDWPSRLESLYIEEVNLIETSMLPKYLTRLVVDKCHRIESLPQGLKELSIKNYLDKVSDTFVFPSTLETLSVPNSNMVNLIFSNTKKMWEILNTVMVIPSIRSILYIIYDSKLISPLSLKKIKILCSNKDVMLLCIPNTVKKMTIGVEKDEKGLYKREYLELETGYTKTISFYGGRSIRKLYFMADKIMIDYMPGGITQEPVCRFVKN